MIFQSNEKWLYPYKAHHCKSASSNHSFWSTKKSFRKIKRKCRAKTAAQTQIQILSPPVAEVVIENEEKTENNQIRGI